MCQNFSEICFSAWKDSHKLKVHFEKIHFGRSPLPRRHPASQQGGRGRWKPGWRSLGEDGGWRFFTILLFSYKIINFSINLWAEAVSWTRRRLFGWKWKFSFEFCQISNDLWAVDWRGCPKYQFSAELEGTRWLKWKWKFCRWSDLIVSFCLEYQCLIRSWGRKYSYDDSINQNIQAFSCSKRTTNKHHQKYENF